MIGDFVFPTPSELFRRETRVVSLLPHRQEVAAYQPPKGPPISLAGHRVGLDELGHVAVIGTNGAGKNLTMGPTLGSLIAAVRHDPSRRLLVLEAKEDGLRAIQGSGVPYALMTFTYSEGKTWEIGRDHGSPQLISQLGYSPFPEMDGQNAFFRNAARALFIAGAISIHTVTRGAWGLDDLVNISLTDSETLKAVLRHSVPGQWVLNTLFEGGQDEEGLTKIRSEAMSRLWPLIVPAAKYQYSGPGISLVDFWGGGPTEAPILVVKVNPEKFDVERPIVQSLLARSFDIIMASPESDRKDKIVWIDDFNFYGRIPKLAEAAELIRGRGGLLITLFQSIEGLKARDSYGDRAEAILANFPWKIMLRACSPETARWCASQYGRDVVREESYGISFSQGGASTREDQRRMVENIVHERAFLTLPLPSEKNGVTLYLTTPKWGDERAKHIPWRQLIERHPPRVDAVRLTPLTSAYELPSIWDEERRRLMTTGRNSPRPEVGRSRFERMTNAEETALMVEMVEVFEHELRECVFDEVMEVIASILSQIK